LPDRAQVLSALNPILLILVAFAIFFAAPSVGKYIMPIALNVASLIIASSKVPE